MGRYKLSSDKAIDGIEAIDKVRERHQKLGDSFKLILMDYSMPHCEGPESVKGIINYLNEYPSV